MRVSSLRSLPTSRLPISTPDWIDRSAYPFASRFMPLSAGRLHYIEEGSGEPIVFLHGTPSWSFEYRHLIRALRRNYRCVAPDLLGFGLSDRPDWFSYTPQGHHAIVSEFVESLRVEQFTLVVHDFGGPIGLPLALEGRVRRLILINTWMWPYEETGSLWQARLAGSAFGGWLYRSLNAPLRLLMPRAFHRRNLLTPAIHRQYRMPFQEAEDRGRVLHSLARSLLGAHDYYAWLWRQAPALRSIPVLLLWGQRDPALGPAFLRRWTDVLPGAIVHPIEAGHWPHEEEPGESVAAVRAFLESTRVRRSPLPTY